MLTFEFLQDSVEQRVNVAEVGQLLLYDFMAGFRRCLKDVLKYCG